MTYIPYEVIHHHIGGVQGLAWGVPKRQPHRSYCLGFMHLYHLCNLGFYISLPFAQLGCMPLYRLYDLDLVL